MNRIYLLIGVYGIVLAIANSSTELPRKPLNASISDRVFMYTEPENVSISDSLTQDNTTTKTPSRTTTTTAVDAEKTDSSTKLIIGLSVGFGSLLILIIIAVILFVIFREKIFKCFSGENVDQGPPGNLFYEPHQFNHKGALKIQKQTPFDMKETYDEEVKDANPPNAHFHFTEGQQNEVFDIGSDIEQIN